MGLASNIHSCIATTGDRSLHIILFEQCSSPNPDVWLEWDLPNLASILIIIMILLLCSFYICYAMNAGTFGIWLGGDRQAGVGHRGTILTILCNGRH